MQELIAQIRPLIDLREQFGNLDVRHQRIGIFSEDFSGFRRVFLRSDAMRRFGIEDNGDCPSR